MPDSAHQAKSEFGSVFASNAYDARMVGRMRVVLASSMMLNVQTPPNSLRGPGPLVWVVVAGYLAHSITVAWWCESGHRGAQSKTPHRLDLVWISLIVLLTGATQNLFFLYFLFVIVCAALRWGDAEGSRMTLASAALYAVGGLLSEGADGVLTLLLRTVFLLSMGYLSVNWGQSKVRALSQLALLRDINRLSNPRFGVDRTFTHMMEQTQRFFDADDCISVTYRNDAGTYAMRRVSRDVPTQSLAAAPVSGELGQQFLDLPKGQLVMATRRNWTWLTKRRMKAVSYDRLLNLWEPMDKDASNYVANMLDASHFMAAPLCSSRVQGRIFVTSKTRRFSRTDALFFNQITEQTWQIIENIEILDKMASNAALYERKKISLDLHDQIIQPYYGLKFGLVALKNKKLQGISLTAEDIDKLIAATDTSIEELRNHSLKIRNQRETQGSMLEIALKRQVYQVREIYGVAIAVSIEESIDVSDRLAGELLQIMREGLSNICKHTLAHQGALCLRQEEGSLNIEIRNECPPDQAPQAFKPRSIAERVASLGGMLEIRQLPEGATLVDIRIPL